MVLQFQQKGGMRGMAVGTPVGRGNGPLGADWTDDRIEQLKSLWTEGLSGSKIAAALGGITRNAVIGKATRLGLTGHRPQRVKATALKAPKISVRSHIPPTPIVEEDPLVLADGNHATVLTINDRMCRWPIGDPGDEGFHFCGRGPREGSPYCEAHAEKAYDRAGTKRYQERVALARAAVKK